jgi:hypothetical protein
MVLRARAGVTRVFSPQLDVVPRFVEVPRMPHRPRRLRSSISRTRALAALALAALSSSIFVASAADADRSLEQASLAPISPKQTANEARPAWLTPGTPFAPAGGSDPRWLATAGLALVLLICGGVGALARRYSPRTAIGGMKVIGRVSLTPKHAVCMVRVGRRVLVVGTGPQGSPSLISEFDESELSMATPESVIAGAGGRDDA